MSNSIHIDLTGETASEIARLAKIESRSTTKEVEVACKAHVKRNKSKLGKETE